MKKSSSKPTFSLCASTLALLCSGALAAPPMPDAGQINRDLSRPPAPALPSAPATAPLRVQDARSTPQFSSETRLLVKSLHVQGSTVYPASQLEALLADLLGGEHSLGELEVGAGRITEFYRAHGYLLAHAYLPAQEIHNGAIEIKVLEGMLGQQILHNTSRLNDPRARAYLGALQPGEVLQSGRIDRALLLLADTPGVAGARGVLQPGTGVGSSDLLIEIDPARATNASLDADNYGNRYTGIYRVGGDLSLNSPLGLGDQFTARLQSSGTGMTNLRLAYQAPVGGDGLRLGAALGNTRYQLGDDFAALQAHGSASSTSVYLSYPLVRTLERNLSGTLNWESKKLVDQTDTPQSETDKQLSLITLGLTGNRQDALGGGGLSALDTALSLGTLDMDSASLALDAAPGSAQSQGSFGKFHYGLTRLQNLGAKDMLWLSLQGQMANKNLASSEKFALGGANAVRAYPLGEGSGDQGWMINLEWRRRLSEPLQAVLFYDVGSVDVNHNTYAVASALGSNSRSLGGAGVGLNAQYQRLQLRSALAWRTSGGPATSEPASADSSMRLWVQLSLGL